MSEQTTNETPSSGIEKGDRHGKAATVFRAATAIVVFAIPLAIGTAAVVGYGAREIYRSLKGAKSSR